jgi:hypothetical protein
MKASCWLMASKDCEETRCYHPPRAPYVQQAVVIAHIYIDGRRASGTESYNSGWHSASPGARQPCKHGKT